MKKLSLVLAGMIIVPLLWGCRGDGLEEGDEETTFDIKGTWSLSAGDYSGTLTVTSASTGQFYGTHRISMWGTSTSISMGDYVDRHGGGVEWDIRVNWRVDFDGTIDNDNRMSGTWSDGQATGNWTATR